MRYLCFLPLFFFVRPCLSQIHSSRPAGYAGVGAYSLDFTDVFSFTANPASLSHIKSTTIGLYSERRYMLNELKRFSTAISFPLPRAGAGITADYFGFAGYNESHGGIAYGKALGQKIDLGVQFNYYRISMAGYGSAGAMNFELGTIIHLSDKLYGGLHIYNPVGGKFGNNAGEKLASMYSFGTGYEASEKLFFSAVLVKEENQPVNVNVSMQYAFVKQIFIRGGLSSASASYFAGAGVSWKNYRLDVAADWHPQAGLTPCMLLIFTFNDSKSDQE
ncbi:MAG: hypothetical protein ABIN89_15985 [Chitinophagaceae bacterium]